MKKILMGLMAIVLVIGLVGAGVSAYFSDSETSEDNSFTAGTLDLKVGGEDDGETVVPVVIESMAPGDADSNTWTLSNTGDIDGDLSLVVSAITNDDNGCNEPEDLVDDSCGSGGGELGAALAVVLTVGGGVVYGPGPLNGMPGTYTTYLDLTPLPTLGVDVDVVLAWSIDSGVDNIIQSDSAEFDITFVLTQTP